jgi:hypothetical protein
MTGWSAITPTRRSSSDGEKLNRLVHHERGRY